MPQQPDRSTRAFTLATATWVLLALIRTSLRIAAIPRPFGTAVTIFGQVLAASLLWLLWAPFVVALAGRLPWRKGERSGEVPESRPLMEWMSGMGCGRTALSPTTLHSEVRRPDDCSSSAGLEPLQTDFC